MTMRKIPFQTPGDYRVQYTNRATEQLESLATALRTRIQDEIKKIASVNPSAHGIPHKDMRDRRAVMVDGIEVSFWVSSEVKTVTVVAVERRFGGVDMRKPMMPRPTPLVLVDDDDEIGVPSMASTA